MIHPAQPLRALLAGLGLLAGAAALSATLAGDSPKAPPLERGWRQMARLQFRRAYETFRTAGESREARFGRAMTLLNNQPKTRANIRAAADALRGLVAENAHDEEGIAAKYFLGRIEQVHRYEPDAGRALAIYERLVREHPDHYYGQMALVKLSILRLYDPAADHPAVLDALEARGRRLAHPDAARSFHLVLADAYCRFGLGEDRALAHLLAVDRLGIATRRAEADLYVRIGELARRAGRTDLAAEYYRRMLDRFPRDARAYMVRQRLEAVQADRPSEAGVSG